MRSRVLAYMKKMMNPQEFQQALSEDDVSSSPMAQQFSPQQQQQPEPVVPGKILQGYDINYDTPPLTESLPTSVASPTQQISAEMIPQKRLEQQLRTRARRFDNSQMKQRGELTYG